MQGFQIPPVVWNILGSAAVSLVVSIFVFIIGVRIGKERTDRRVMRERYQDLFQHFKALSDSIEAKKLKIWRDYPLIGQSYSPTVQAYLNDGTLNLFPSSLGKKMLDLETDTLVASSKIVHEVFTKIAPAVEGAVVSALSKEAPSQGTKRIREVSTLQLALMDKSEFKDLKTALEADRETYLSVNTSEERGKVRTKYVRSDNLKDGDLTAFIEHLESVVAAEKREDYSALIGVEKRLTDMLAVLGKRIRDPHPLRETVGSTLSDMFR
jgi:hypothetical protein